MKTIKTPLFNVFKVFQKILIFKIKGDWNLIEYITSVDGKPWPPHAPYLCPEQRMSVTIDSGKKKMNISQVILLCYTKGL